MNIYNRIFFIALFICVALPGSAQANQTIEQSAVRLSDEVVLYTITYDFGFLNADVWMPVGAVRDTSAIGKPPFAAYSFHDQAGEVVEVGESYSIILSDASVVDGSYHIPERTRAVFTLLSLLRVPADTEINQGVSLQVTSLPHKIKRTSEDSTFIRLVGETDLEQYRTDSVSF